MERIYPYILGIVFFISLFTSTDSTIPYFIVVGLFLLSIAFLVSKKYKPSFIVFSVSLMTYSFPLGHFCHYFIQDLLPQTEPHHRVMCYGVLYTIPFVVLSVVSIWLLHKSIKTLKYKWYIAFLITIILSSWGLEKGFGTNYLFKIVLLALNVLAYKKMKAMMPSSLS